MFGFLPDVLQDVNVFGRVYYAIRALVANALVSSLADYLLNLPVAAVLAPAGAAASSVVLHERVEV